MVAATTNVRSGLGCLLDGTDWYRRAAINTEIHIDESAAIGCGRIAASIFFWSLGDRCIGAVAINALTTVFSLHTVLMGRTIDILTVVEDALSIFTILVWCALNICAWRVDAFTCGA